MVIRLAVIAPDTVTLKGVSTTLQAADHISIVSGTVDTRSMMSYLPPTNPDILLVWTKDLRDIRNAKFDAIVSRIPKLLVLVISQEVSGQELINLLRKGVRGIGCQPEDLDAVVPMILDFANNKTYMCTTTQRIHIDHIVNPEREVSSVLTPMQLRIAPLLCRGASNVEIAQALGIKLRTVKDHLQRLYRRLDVRRRTQAVARLNQIGMFQ